MRRRGYIAIAIIVVIAIAMALVLRIIDSESDNRRRRDEAKIEEMNETYSGLVAEYSGDGVCEVLVELGAVYRSSTVSKTIRVINRSATPLVMVDYTTQCRCMWLELQREPIAPGEYRDIELIFDSRGEWGSVGNYMEIATSTEDAPISLWIAAEIE
jgi:hypothetical protein